jgi:hypothetical protein
VARKLLNGKAFPEYVSKVNWVSRYFFLLFNIFLQLLGVSVRQITIRVTEPQLLQVPRHPILSQMRSSEAPERMKCLSVFQLHVLANLPEAVSQNVTLCQRSARLNQFSMHSPKTPKKCFLTT